MWSKNRKNRVIYGGPQTAENCKNPTPKFIFVKRLLISYNVSFGIQRVKTNRSRAHSAADRIASRFREGPIPAEAALPCHLSGTMSASIIGPVKIDVAQRFRRYCEAGEGGVASVAVLKVGTFVGGSVGAAVRAVVVVVGGGIRVRRTGVRRVRRGIRREEAHASRTRVRQRIRTSVPRCRGGTVTSWWYRLLAPERHV